MSKSGVASKRRWPVPAGRTATSPTARSKAVPVAAELHVRPSTGDAENLVNGRMIVDERVNAVTPAPSPAVILEHVFDHTGRIPRRRAVDGLAIHDERQGGIVGDHAVIGEHERLQPRGADSLCKTSFLQIASPGPRPGQQRRSCESPLDGTQCENQSSEGRFRITLFDYPPCAIRRVQVGRPRYAV